MIYLEAGSSGEVVKSSILVIEPNWTGHRLAYVRMIVVAARDRNIAATVAVSPGTTRTAEWRTFLSDVEDWFSTVELSGTTLPVLERLASETRSFATLVPDGDRLVTELAVRGWSGVGRISVLVMRATRRPNKPLFMNSIRFITKRALMLIASRRKHVAVYALRSAYGGHHRTVRSIADPFSVTASTQAQDRARLECGLTPDVRWVAIVGAISARKNAEKVALALVDLQNVEVGLLLAGKVEKDVWSALLPALDVLRERGMRVVIRDQLLPPDLLDGVIRVADVVVLAHSNEGPSGILAKAVALGTPVVAAGAHSLRKDVKPLVGRAIWVPLTVGSLSAGIAAMLRSTRTEPAEVREADASAQFLVGLLGE